MSINVTKKLKSAITVEKINERLNSCGWYEPLKEYLDSPKFLAMIDLLYSESIAGINFTPSLKNVFNVFEYCPYEKLKCVILAPGPYPKKGVADGLAFSCGKTMTMEKDLKIIYTSIDKTTNIIKNHSPSLRKWSDQGVFLLNASLTTRIDTRNTHRVIWEEFTMLLLSRISQLKIGVPVVFIGQYSNTFYSCIDDSHLKVLLGNPLAELYAKNSWKHYNFWDKINENLSAQNKQQINW